MLVIFMKKILNLDTFRFMVAFLIVAIHVYPFVSINSELDYYFTHVFCRIGVPLFLMITGYFILPKDIATLKKYTIKIIKIYLLCMLIYLPINIYAHQLQSWSILDLIKNIFLNGTFYHLWYFPALILGLWVTYFLIKHLNKKLVWVIVVILYIIGLLGDSYYGTLVCIPSVLKLYNIIFQVFDYTRNGLFYVPIFLMLGYSFKDKEKTNNKLLIVGLIISFVFMFLESYFLRLYDLQRHDSMYLFLVPVMYYLFSLIIYNTNGSNKKLRSLATIIYIIHPLVIIGIRFIGGILNIDDIIVYNNLIHYILVCLISLLCSYLFIKILELIKSKKSS